MHDQNSIDKNETSSQKYERALDLFTEEVRAVDYQEAREVALARNPNARIISVNAVF